MYVRSLFTDPLRGPKEREIQTHGVRMLVRRRTSDTFVIDEVFRRHVYGEPPTGVVLDLGANIGAFSVFAAKNGARVFAFEPESTNYAQLKKNLELNSLNGVTVFKKAVGGNNGFAQMSHAKVNRGASSIVNKRSSTFEQVEVVTLEHALKLCGVDEVDFLKVDIEGSEYSLIESASLDTLRRIQAIAMETHPVSGKRVAYLVAKLRDAGFDVRKKYTHLAPFGMLMLYASRRNDREAS